jgi:hypothetical protein
MGDTTPVIESPGAEAERRYRAAMKAAGLSHDREGIKRTIFWPGYVAVLVPDQTGYVVARRHLGMSDLVALGFSAREVTLVVFPQPFEGFLGHARLLDIGAQKPALVTRAEIIKHARAVVDGRHEHRIVFIEGAVATKTNCTLCVGRERAEHFLYRRSLS